jgi:hypothetical protein
METNGIADHSHAVAAYEKAHPRPTPANGSGPWNFFGPQPETELDLKDLYAGNDEKWLQNAIADTLNKVHGG